MSWKMCFGQHFYTQKEKQKDEFNSWIYKYLKIDSFTANKQGFETVSRNSVTNCTSTWKMNGYKEFI